MRFVIPICVLLASVAVTQEQPSEALARARVAEEVEHDLQRAAKLYAEVAAQSDSAPTRARAWLRLADVSVKLGDVEGAEQALAEAAAGEGPAALEAQRRVQGTAGGDGQVLDLIARLRRGSDSAADLVWLGAEAAAPLITWLDRDRIDLQFVTRATTVLIQIGGADVYTWLGRVQSSYGALERRAVLRGTQSLGSIVDHDLIEPSLVALRGFALDPDAMVVRDALQMHPALFTKSRVLDLIGHQDAALRAAARHALRHWEQQLRGVSTVAMRRRLLDTMVEHANEARDEEWQAAARAFGRDMETSEGREMFLLATERLRIGVPIRSTRETIPCEPDAQAQSVMRVARSLGPYDNRSGPHRNVESIVELTIDSWTESSAEVVLTLFELGYADKLGSEFNDYFTRCVAAGSPELFEPLRDYATGVMAGRSSRARSLSSIITPIVTLGSEQALSWIARYSCAEMWRSGVVVRGEVQAAAFFDLVVDALVDAPDTSASRLALRILAAEFPSRSDVDSPVIQAFVALAKRSDAESVPLFARLFEPGVFTPEKRDSLLQWMVSNDQDLDAEFQTAVLDACLATGRSEVWAALGTPSTNRSRPIDWSKRRWPLPRIVLKHADTAPEGRGTILSAAFRADRGAELREPMFAALQDPDAAVRAAALTGIEHHFAEDPSIIEPVAELLSDPNSRNARTALELISDIPDPRTIGLVEPMLRHQWEKIRQDALEALAFELDPARAVEWALVLKDDPSVRVRQEICYIANRTLDQRLVPVLIEMLPNTELRTQAQQTLDAIRYYRDEQARWRRILDGTDLGAASAAEALVKQARDGADAEIRLAAVQSLGTLGAPETLPFLITLMRDPVAEVAAAARQAIDRINARR